MKCYGIWRKIKWFAREEEEGWLVFISGFFPTFPTKRAAQIAIEEYKKIWPPLGEATTYEPKEMK